MFIVVGVKLPPSSDRRPAGDGPAPFVGVKDPGEFSASWGLSFCRKKTTAGGRAGLPVISDNLTSNTSLDLLSRLYGNTATQGGPSAWRWLWLRGSHSREDASAQAPAPGWAGRAATAQGPSVLTRTARHCLLSKWGTDKQTQLLLMDVFELAGEEWKAGNVAVFI